MPRPSSSTSRSRARERERQQAKARAVSEKADKAARRRRLIAVVVLAAMVLATVGAVIGAVALDESSTATTTTTSISPPTTQPPADVTFPEPGVFVDDPVACPPDEGAAERATEFASPPPPCLPEGVDHRMTLHTDAGDLVFLLTTEQAPEAVNSVLTLARYGFYDDAVFDLALRSAWVEVGGRFRTAEGERRQGPGYTLASEAPDVGSLPFPGAIGLVPVADGVMEGGRLVLVTGENGAGLPPDTTLIGLLLDGTTAFTALAQAGSDNGQPTAEIRIESVSIEAIPANSAGD